MFSLPGMSAAARHLRYRIECDVSWEHRPGPDGEQWHSDLDRPLVHPALFGDALGGRIELQ
jgi:hypothetical protein